MLYPPLGREAIERGNTDGGHSVMLFHRHKSGRISAGRAVLHKGKVAWWYPGEIGDYMHSPESAENCADPIVEWALFPDAAELVRMIS